MGSSYEDLRVQGRTEVLLGGNPKSMEVSWLAC